MAKMTRRILRNLRTWWKRTRVVGIDANGNFVSRDRFGGNYIMGKVPKMRPTLPIQVVTPNTLIRLPIHFTTAKD